MTRREFMSAATAAPLLRAASRPPVIVPVHQLLDGRVKWRPEQVRYFWSSLWPEAVHDLERCGIQLQCSPRQGEVSRPPFRPPVITGLDGGAINLVVTDVIPMQWDNGLALGGVTTLYRGYHLCMIALNHAHCHQVPFVSLNTCLHELLHALLHDIFEGRPPGWRGQERELRIDWYATLLWLFHDGAAIRKAAEAYVERLRLAAPTQS